ncbi:MULTISPECIES: hypothetical protein [Pseudomonas]|uniref:Lipoprotein n=2 Tax=Pseudomonas TaxID=286 RepID=A0A2X2CE38_PSELU|nr:MULTISPECIES: hypothetical protein [Pseudomonas]ENA29998.1 hypothetical protein HMPREF1487_08252 [Pseudomonas sp. HPB0071]MBA1247435.1 hypothetical protein [Pseudomonas zeshuii]MBF8643588.1 hypothetical protein [Pseudomonas zeshuii]QEU28982.1 hypothetical protein FOB45_14890 [Pseudomonas luteola]RRW41235.1 hypothetical protein EGJ50_22950 [Pseudomonas luteola]
MKRNVLLIAIAFVCLAGCSPTEKDAIEKSQALVKKELKDPKSAKFGYTYFLGSLSSGTGDGYVCGRLSGVGVRETAPRFMRYVSSVSVKENTLVINNIWVEAPDNTSILGTKETIFDRLYWNKYCVDARHPASQSGI